MAGLILDWFLQLRVLDSVCSTVFEHGACLYNAEPQVESWDEHTSIRRYRGSPITGFDSMACGTMMCPKLLRRLKASNGSPSPELSRFRACPTGFAAGFTTTTVWRRLSNRLFDNLTVPKLNAFLASNLPAWCCVAHRMIWSLTLLRGCMGLSTLPITSEVCFASFFGCHVYYLNAGNLLSTRPTGVISPAGLSALVSKAKCSKNWRISTCLWF